MDTIMKPKYIFNYLIIAIFKVHLHHNCSCFHSPRSPCRRGRLSDEDPFPVPLAPQSRIFKIFSPTDGADAQVSPCGIRPPFPEPPERVEGRRREIQLERRLRPRPAVCVSLCTTRSRVSSSRCEVSGGPATWSGEAEVTQPAMGRQDSTRGPS